MLKKILLTVLISYGTVLWRQSGVVVSVLDFRSENQKVGGLRHRMVASLCCFLR